MFHAYNYMGPTAVIKTGNSRRSNNLFTTR